MLVGILVYAVYCVWNESYFALNQKTNVAIVFFVLSGLLNLFIAFSGILGGSMIENGRFTEKFLNLEIGIIFLILMAVIVIRKMYNKIKDEAEDDDSAETEEME